MNLKKLIVTAMLILLLFSSHLCKPLFGLRLRRLIREIFYIPLSGEPYLNKSIALEVKSSRNMCLQGVCVPFHLCVDGNVLTTGANIFGPRLASDDGSDGPRFCSDMEKCCKLSDDEDNNMGLDDENDELEITNQLYGDLEDDTKEIKDYSDNEMLEYTDNWRPQCGVRNFNLLKPRIAGEETAESMEFPWMVVILKKSPTSKFYDYQCGGSLIHPSAVLTAAHCVAQIKPKFLHIRAGEWDMKNTDEILPHQDREIQSVVIHRYYIKSTLVNDIAILILKVPVELADNVNPICLPPPNHSFDNQRCIVTGWGKDNHGNNGKFQSVLKKVEVPIIPNNMCEMMLRNTILGYYFRLDNSFLCAGAEYGKDSCKGDGGSPLVCRISNTSNSYYQAGVVSWGIGCKETNIPGAYVNVARFRGWIDKVMSRMSLESDSYIYDL